VIVDLCKRREFKRTPLFRVTIKIHALLSMGRYKQAAKLIKETDESMYTAINFLRNRYFGVEADVKDIGG